MDDKEKDTSKLEFIKDYVLSNKMISNDRPVSPLIEQIQKLEQRIKEIEDGNKRRWDVLRQEKKTIDLFFSLDTELIRLIWEEIERLRRLHAKYKKNYKQPHKCPVCDGSGIRKHEEQLILGHIPKCFACEGEGIVWG